MKGSGKGISFCLVVLSVFSFVSLSQAQAEPTIAREMLSWLPEVYEGGNVYKSFGYLNNSLEGEEGQALNASVSRTMSVYPVVFLQNIAHFARATAFSTGFRSYSLVEKASLVHHIKNRKDLSPEIRERLREGVESESRENKKIDWLPNVFILKRGEETLKKFIKAGLLSDTGESLEGRPIYSVSKKVNLNREPDNWAWFDGEETLISSNLVSNLALMIYAGQGQEPSILQKKEFVPFFERTKESDLYTFSFLDLKGVVAFQHSQALQEGVPAKELAKVKQMYAESQQRFVSFGIFKDGELKNEEEYYFDSEAYARDSMQGEEWHKAKMKAGEERYFGIDKVIRDKKMVRVVSNYSGEKLTKLIEQKKVLVKEWKERREAVSKELKRSK